MIRLLEDHVVLDWNIFSWCYKGEIIQQVQVLLGNGIILILDIEDFLQVSDDRFC